MAALAVAGVMLAALALPAQAQFERRQQQPSGGFNPFSIFTPLFQRPQPRDPREMRERYVPREPRTATQAPASDQTKPPPPQKSDATVTRRIVVMGASLSDWLAYGLEDIYADQPDVGIIRKNHVLTGLVRFDARDETTWPRVARDFLKDQSPDIIVVMLGLEDRLAIRDRAAAREPQEQNPPAGSDQPAVATPEPRRATGPSYEFRTEQWAEVYAKRVDEMIAAVRSKGVPVIWVGLPAIRGTRSTSDMIYLNDLFRARAERAGIIYVDVWDGFVDEAGRYANFGPDVEGQVRRLRTAEGVYFTKPGARKLAHYVEREISRVMGTKLQPMALPGQEEPGQPAVARPGEPAAQPVAGPVLPLTTAAGASELLGAGARTGVADALADRVLVKGTAILPPSGRADNFFLTPEAAEAAKAATPVEPVGATAAVAPSAPAAAVPADELLGGEPGAPPTKKPVAAVEPTAKGGSASRAADGRQQPTNRTAVQKQRPNTPRDGRAVERPRPPFFNPFGLFR